MGLSNIVSRGPSRIGLRSRSSIGRRRAGDISVLGWGTEGANGLEGECPESGLAITLWTRISTLQSAFCCGRELLLFGEAHGPNILAQGKHYGWTLWASAQRDLVRTGRDLHPVNGTA